MTHTVIIDRSSQVLSSQEVIDIVLDNRIKSTMLATLLLESEKELVNIGSKASIQTDLIGDVWIDVQQRAIDFNKETNSYSFQLNRTTKVIESEGCLMLQNSSNIKIAIALYAGIVVARIGGHSLLVGTISPLNSYRLGLVIDNIQTERIVTG